MARVRADTPVPRRDYLRILVTVSAGLAAGAAGVAVGLFRRHGAGTATPVRVADRLDPGQAVAFRYPGEVDPTHPYRARQLAPYRRDAGLHDSGLTGRYPGLRGSGSRDPRVHSPGPGPGAGADTEPDRASMLNAIVATVVVGQLWGLMVALNAWLEHDNGQVAALVGFQLLSFAVAVAVWRAA